MSPEKNDEVLDAKVDFRCEAELKEAVERQAKVFSIPPSVLWRVAGIKMLGSGAPASAQRNMAFWLKLFKDL